MRPKAILALAALVTLAGCSRDAWQRKPALDDVMAAVPWFATMRDGIAIQPYEAEMRLPPEGSIPITGSEPYLTVSTANADTLRRVDALRNPIQPTGASLERGADRYQIFCQPCHGGAGAGDGPVNTAMFGMVPAIITDQANDRSDGYLYTLIRNGRGAMSGYGDRLRGDDRWHVVNYIRQLQGAAQ